MTSPLARSEPRPRRRLAALAAALSLGALAGSGLYTLSYAEGLSYLSDDPRACVNCHVMRPHLDGWQKGPHHAHATCNDCHVPHDPLGKWIKKVEHGWGHSKAFTLGGFHEPIRITPEDREVVRQNCQRCHAELVSGLGPPRGGAAPGHEPADCLHCHERAGHGPRR